MSISGSLTAAACISYPWLCDPKFATDTSVRKTKEFQTIVASMEMKAAAQHAKVEREEAPVTTPPSN